MTFKHLCKLAAVSVLGLMMCIGIAAQNPEVRREARATPKLVEGHIVEQARALLASGKSDSALELLATQVQLRPKDTAARQLLGTLYYHKNDFLRAIQHLTVTVENLPTAAERRQAIQMLALSHYALGHFMEAIPFLERVQGNVPDNTEIAYALGNSYLMTHDADKARASFARMFNVAPESAAAHLINAQMMIRQKFEETAESELRRAAELDPKLPQVNFMLGEMAIYQAKLDDGVALLGKEIALNPAFGLAYYRLGEAYTRQLKWDEAIAPLQKAVLLSPNFSGSYIVLGKIYLKQKKFEDAEAMLRRAAQMDPNNFSAHHLLAQVLQQTNRLDDARKEFELAERLRTATTTAN